MDDKARDTDPQVDDGVQPESVSLWPLVLLIVLMLLLLGGGGGLFIVMRVRRARMEAQKARARADLDSLKAALRMFRIDTQGLPVRLNDLAKPAANGKGPWIAEIPSDPWGRPYRIERSGRARIVSDGPDGEAGTEDDAELQVPINNARALK